MFPSAPESEMKILPPLLLITCLTSEIIKGGEMISLLKEKKMHADNLKTQL